MEGMCHAETGLEKWLPHMGYWSLHSFLSKSFVMCQWQKWNYCPVVEQATKYSPIERACEDRKEIKSVRGDDS